MTKSFSFTGRDNYGTSNFTVFSEWENLFSPMYEVTDRSHPGSDFLGRLDAWGSSGALIADISSAYQVFDRNEYMAKFNPVEGLTVILPKKGKIDLKTCGRCFEIKEGDAVVIGGDGSYSLNFSEFEVFIIVIPFSVLGSYPCVLRLEKIFYLDGKYPGNKILIEFISGECERLKKLWRIDYSVRVRVISKALLDMLKEKYIPRIKGGRLLSNLWLIIFRIIYIHQSFHWRIL